MIILKKFKTLTTTYLLHLSPLQHSTQVQSSYQFRVHTGVKAYNTKFNLLLIIT